MLAKCLRLFLAMCFTAPSLAEARSHSLSQPPIHVVFPAFERTALTAAGILSEDRPFLVDGSEKRSALIYGIVQAAQWSERHPAWTSTILSLGSAVLSALGIISKPTAGLLPLAAGTFSYSGPSDLTPGRVNDLRSYGAFELARQHASPALIEKFITARRRLESGRWTPEEFAKYFDALGDRQLLLMMMEKERGLPLTPAFRQGMMLLLHEASVKDIENALRFLNVDINIGGRAETLHSVLQDVWSLDDLLLLPEKTWSGFPKNPWNNRRYPPKGFAFAQHLFLCHFLNVATGNDLLEAGFSERDVKNILSRRAINPIGLGDSFFGQIVWPLDLDPGNLMWDTLWTRNWQVTPPWMDWALAQWMTDRPWSVVAWWGMGNTFAMNRGPLLESASNMVTAFARRTDQPAPLFDILKEAGFPTAKIIGEPSGWTKAIDSLRFRIVQDDYLGDLFQKEAPVDYKGSEARRLANRTGFIIDRWRGRLSRPIQNEPLRYHSTKTVEAEDIWRLHDLRFSDADLVRIQFWIERASEDTLAMWMQQAGVANAEDVAAMLYGAKSEFRLRHDIFEAPVHYPALSMTDVLTLVHYLSEFVSKPAGIPNLPSQSSSKHSSPRFIPDEPGRPVPLPHHQRASLDLIEESAELDSNDFDPDPPGRQTLEQIIRDSTPHTPLETLLWLGLPFRNLGDEEMDMLHDKQYAREKERDEEGDEDGDPIYWAVGGIAILLFLIFSCFMSHVGPGHSRAVLLSGAALSVVIGSFLTIFSVRTQTAPAGAKRKGDQWVPLLQRFVRVPEGILNPDNSFTEVLLRYILKAYPWKFSGKTVREIGTGTGVLAIALARKGATVFAGDIYEGAMHTAKINIKLENLSVQNRITVAQSNLYQAIPGEPADGKTDFVVSNYPLYSQAPAHDGWQYAHYSGEDYGVNRAILAGLPAHLKRGGAGIVWATRQQLNARGKALQLPFANDWDFGFWTEARLHESVPEGWVALQVSSWKFWRTVKNNLIDVDVAVFKVVEIAALPFYERWLVQFFIKRGVFGPAYNKPMMAST